LVCAGYAGNRLSNMKEESADEESTLFGHGRPGGHADPRANRHGPAEMTVEQKMEMEQPSRCPRAVV
jgi:hypothetical protein